MLTDIPFKQNKNARCSIQKKNKQHQQEKIIPIVTVVIMYNFCKYGRNYVFIVYDGT